MLCVLRVLFKGTPQGEQINSLISTSYTNSQGDIKTKFKLEPRYENAVEVIKSIDEIKSDSQAVRTNIENTGISIYGSVKNILNAYNVIYHFLASNYDDQAKLKKYWGHLATDVVFIQISSEVSSALKIFETINERGIGLDPMDLLKNLLFKQVPAGDFSKLKDEWKNITSLLEKNKEKPLRFLRYFLMANYEIKNYRDNKPNDPDYAVVREDEIYGWVAEQKNAELTGYQKTPFEFVRLIARNVERYINFSKGLGNDGESSIAMESLTKLTGVSVSSHYVLLLAAADLPKSIFDQFVSQLENFFFYYIFTKTSASELERNFSLWADKVRGIARIESAQERRNALNKFIDACFKKNMAKKSTELNETLQRLTLYSTRRYRMRYLLARLTQHVDMAYRGEKDRASLDPYFQLEIEHILPKNPKGDLRAFWQEHHPELAYDEIKNRLGNLTLLEKPINRVANNNFYADKLTVYAKSGNYLTRSLCSLADVGHNTSISRINKKLSSFKEWGAKNIEKRQSLLIRLAHDIWQTTEIN